MLLLVLMRFIYSLSTHSQVLDLKRRVFGVDAIPFHVALVHPNGERLRNTSTMREADVDNTTALKVNVLTEDEHVYTEDVNVYTETLKPT